MNSIYNKKPKNIVFILSDDQGYWSLGASGNEEIITPNIDKLADGGIIFENFFCASPVCSPARASLLTGRIPSQHGIHDWLDHSNEETKTINYLENQNSYVDVLKEHGYKCGLSGKWHMGDSATPQKGFDHWFAHESGSSPYYETPMFRDGKLYIETDYITDVITNDAISFIQNYKDEPFYLHVGYTAPHSPWIDNHPKEFTDLYEECEFKSVPRLDKINPNSVFLTKEVAQNEKENLIGYFAAVSAMDYNIGKIVKTLEELDILNDTLIVFTSDNGFNAGHHGIWGKGNATFPINLFDTSVKVPFILNYSGFKSKGRAVDNLVSGYDIRPTILDLLELDDSPDINLPGRSFVDMIGNNIEEVSTKDIIIFDEYGPNRMIRNKNYKLIKRYPYGPDEFYDLQVDKKEINNEIDNDKYSPIIEELNDKLLKWFNKYAKPEIDGVKERVYGSGQKNLAGEWSSGSESYVLGDYIKDTSYFKCECNLKD